MYVVVDSYVVAPLESCTCSVHLAHTVATRDEHSLTFPGHSHCQYLITCSLQIYTAGAHILSVPCRHSHTEEGLVPRLHARVHVSKYLIFKTTLGGVNWGVCSRIFVFIYFQPLS